VGACDAESVEEVGEPGGVADGAVVAVRGWRVGPAMSRQIGRNDVVMAGKLVEHRSPVAP
jgi:hypothetical protein